jgi:hypothetical protein
MGTSGFIQMTVTPNGLGQVSGDMSGSNTWRGQDKCPNGTDKQWTNHREFSGTLSGSIDTKTGVLKDVKMTGKTSYSRSGGCTEYSNIDKTDVDLVLYLDGAVDLTNHTAKGTIHTHGDPGAANSGDGDWHAGE